MTSSFLDGIHSPEDIRHFSPEQRTQLAQALRRRIIDVMACNGGHLASNLGTVELTIALHTVFQSPKDKFIWDVGHQAYSHKLLTGRNDSFDSIRQFEGLCGFTEPKESSHDHFHAGHAGVALSQALGVAKNRDLCGEEEFVVPIIGDATLTCGMTLEAMNNIPPHLRRFIVILNDNRMSISKNVGAVTRILSRFLNNTVSNRIFQDLDALVSRIPSYGNLLAGQGRRLTQSVKNLVSPAVFFEHYGLSYIGPIDGHNVEELIDTLEGVKNSSWPVIIHIQTEKGHGMTEGMKKNPINWHGPKPFDPDTGKIKPSSSKRPSFPKIFGQQMVKMAEEDPSLCVITPAMSLGSCLDPFIEQFPERAFDVGIAESHSVTFAGGLAYGKNLKVVVSIYSTFLQRALDNLFHDVVLQENPVVFAIDRGGLATGDGGSHSGIYDIGFLSAMPDMVICQPRNGQVLRELFESAFDWKRPTAIRYPNLPTDDNQEPLLKRRLGEAEILAEGEGTLIIPLGHLCELGLEVRERLKEYGVNATVLDPVFVKPLDEALLRRLLLKHEKIMTIEEHSVRTGLGATVNHFLMGEGFSHLRVLNFGIPDRILAQGSYNQLMESLGLTADSIVQHAVKKFGWKLQAPQVAHA